MAGSAKDPTEPIRLKASRYPEVDEGTACTQSSFKTGGKAFRYVGMQGGRYKAMFKLQPSMPEATKLAKKQPTRYEVGSNKWVTASFTADAPMPKTLWTKWLDESYSLSVTPSTSRKAVGKKTSKKKIAKKPIARGRVSNRAKSAKK